MERYGLAELWGVVLDGEVAEGGVTGFYLYGVGAEGAHVVDVGVMVEGYNGRVGVLAFECHVFEP